MSTHTIQTPTYQTAYISAQRHVFTLTCTNGQNQLPWYSRSQGCWWPSTVLAAAPVALGWTFSSGKGDMPTEIRKGCWPALALTHKDQVRNSPTSEPVAMKEDVRVVSEALRSTACEVP